MPNGIYHGYHIANVNISITQSSPTVNFFMLTEIIIHV
jgi:hypothetical protein